MLHSAHWESVTQPSLCLCRSSRSADPDGAGCVIASVGSSRCSHHGYGNTIIDMAGLNGGARLLLWPLAAVERARLECRVSEETSCIRVTRVPARLLAFDRRSLCHIVARMPPEVPSLACSHTFSVSSTDVWASEMRKNP